MQNKSYDVIVIGAGSVGVPIALSLAKRKYSVLVIDQQHGPGQENNKKAIGGVRATHSDYGKIQIAKQSIEIFSTWQEQYGVDIGWRSHGYSYPAYDEQIEKNLKGLMKIQRSYGLNIRWLEADEYEDLVPGIVKDGLRGSTFAPEDGNCSPLLAMSAMYFRSVENGAEYAFAEKVLHIKMHKDSAEVKTDKNHYYAATIVNAAGSYAKEIGEMVGISIPVEPDNHEAGITEPVKQFFKPMVVDMRKAPGSANFYFYQNHEGQVVFCITPEPPILGIDNRSTSEFLPMCSKRMLQIYPRLRYLRVRRTWRGQYPMTPDGFPIVGALEEMPNFVNAVGMCGQGFMLGPGMGELVSKIIDNDIDNKDRKVLQSFNFYRSFSGTEAFK